MGHVHRRLIAFDLDGTLVDSRQDLANSANELLAELGAPPLPVTEVARMVGDGAAELVKRVLVASGLSMDPVHVVRFLAIYDTRLLDHTRLYDGIRDAMAHAVHCATVAVVTNKPRLPSERILSALGVRDLVDHVVGGDGPHPRKPDPAGLLDLARTVGVEPLSTMLVGDSAIDRETARRAGARCCLVTYGFGSFDTLPNEPEWMADDAAGIIQAIDRFAELTLGGSRRDVHQKL